MIGVNHRRSEELAVRAATAKRAGEEASARELYKLAAAAEAQAVAEVPLELARTWSALAVSHVALLYKGWELDEAETAAYRYLATGAANSWARHELKALLEVITDEQVVRDELQAKYSSEAVNVSLRGGLIGSGTGPLEVILDRVNGLQSILVRVAEYVAGRPLRTRGGPEMEFIRRIGIRTVQPTTGSYRFAVRFTEPIQPPLIDGEHFIPPAKVAGVLFDFVAAVAEGAPDDVTEVVPDEGYRGALLRLLNNFVPSQSIVEEVSIYRPEETGARGVVLSQAVRPRIKAAIPKSKTELADESEDFLGTLRALHLDEKWLVLTLPDGEHVRFTVDEGTLDDVVGPMVNRHVRVTGSRKSTRGSTVFHMKDIELDEDR